MYCSPRGCQIVIFVICIAVAGCGARQQRPVERLAVPAAENLSGDPRFDWVGFAVSAIVAGRLSGSPSLNAIRTVRSREAAAVRATRVLHGYYDVSAGRLSLRFVLEDLDTNRTLLAAKREGAYPAGVIELAGEVVSAIAEPVREFGSGNIEAVQALGEALAAPDPRESERALRRSLDADPDFVDAALQLAQLLLSSSRREEALELLDEVRAKAGVDEFDRSRLEALLAGAGADPALAADAAQRYARLVPADSDAAERAAVAALRVHRYQDAAELYRKAAAIEPDRPDLWNASAYPSAYAGDLRAAIESLQRYEEANPENANVFDSFGEIHFRFGQYDAAERFFLKAIEKSPEFQNGAALVKAARCRVMTGDLEGADELFQRHVRFRSEADDAPSGLYHARWLRWTGRADLARAMLSEIIENESSPSGLVSLAHADLAFWALLDDEREQAASHAGEAIAAAGGRIRSGNLLAVQFLSQSDASPEEWLERADRVFPHASQNGMKRELLLYAYLLSERFDAALPLAEALCEESAPFAGDQFQVLLAWTLVETGGFARAAGLLEPNPIIQPGVESPGFALAFPRILYLRGATAWEAGKAETAVKNLRLYLHYAGGSPAALREIEKAREILAAASG